MKKLTSTEIEQLHVFVRSRFVEFYDVELEMVDHLANGIETQWQTNPTLSFEDAKQIEFKKFGIFGFVGVIEKKQGELTNIYLKELVQHLKSFFTLPKIVISIAIYLTLFAIGFRGGELGQDILFGLFTLLFVGYLGVSLQWSYSIKKKRKQTHKYLLDSIAMKVYFGGAMMPIIINFWNFITATRKLSIVGLLVFCLILLLFSLWSYIVIFIFKPYFNEQLQKLDKVYA